MLSPLSEYACPGEHRVVVTWRTVRITPANNSVHYPLASGGLTLEGPTAVSKATVRFSLSSIPGAYHFAGDYPGSIVCVQSAVGGSIQLCCTCPIGDNGHAGLLQDCSWFSFTEHLSPAWQKKWRFVKTIAATKREGIRTCATIDKLRKQSNVCWKCERVFKGWSESGFQSGYCAFQWRTNPEVQDSGDSCDFHCCPPLLSRNSHTKKQTILVQRLERSHSCALTGGFQCVFPGPFSSSTQLGSTAVHKCNR